MNSGQFPCLKHGDGCNYKGAERDAALSILLQETLTCSFLMVFCAGKAEVGVDTTVSSHNLRGLLGWETCWESGEYPSTLMRSRILGWELSEAIEMVNKLNDQAGKLHMQVIPQVLHTADL